MIPERLEKIINLLISKTADRKAIWNKASGDSQFKLSIPDGTAVIIGRWPDNYGNVEFSVVIFNPAGDAIERFSTDSDGVTRDELDLLKRFHKAASDSYYKVDETMEALFASINELDVIGENEEEPPIDISSAPDDDELPF